MDTHVKYPRSKEKLSQRRRILRKKIAERRKATPSHCNSGQLVKNSGSNERQQKITTAQETAFASKTVQNTKKATILSKQLGKPTINNQCILGSSYAGRVLLAARPELEQSFSHKRSFHLNKPPIPKRTTTITTKLNPNLLQEYGNEKASILGEGRFGCVRLMQYRSTLVAVKKSKDRKHSYLIDAEAHILSSLGDHPGFPYCYGLCEKDGAKLLVMEFCGVKDTKSTTLNDALMKTKKVEDNIWPEILFTLAESIAYMHVKGYIHCDIHGNNILMMQRGSIWSPVIIDFGKCVQTNYAQQSQKDRDPRDKEKYPHIAPELFDGKCASTLTDSYSFGFLAKRICRKVKTCYIYYDIAKECYQDNADFRLSLESFIDKFNKINV